MAMFLCFYVSHYTFIIMLSLCLNIVLSPYSSDSMSHPLSLFSFISESLGVYITYLSTVCLLVSLSILSIHLCNTVSLSLCPFLSFTLTVRPSVDSLITNTSNKFF